MLNIKPCFLVVCLFGVAISAQRTILDILRSTPELSRFNQFISSPSNVHLVNLLSEPSANVTIFAPVNEACEQWGQLQFGSRLSDVQLSNALNFHVIPQQLILNRDLSEGFQQYPTLYHPYDWRIARPVSLEAPEDLTRGLTIYGKSSNAVIFRGLGVPARFIKADIIAGNGVIHTIDQVLSPPLSLWNTLQMRGLTRLIEYIKLAKLMDAFRSYNRVTLLVPTNEAWAQFQIAHPDMSPELLRNVLLSHVIPGSYLSQDFAARRALQILAKTGEAIRFAINPQRGMTVGPASILMPDILTDSAVLHVINKVLMPGELSSGVY